MTKKNLELRDAFARMKKVFDDYKDALEGHQNALNALRAKKGVYDAEYLAEQEKSLTSGFKPLQQKAFSDFNDRSREMVEVITKLDNMPLEGDRIGAVADAIGLIQSGALDYTMANRLNAGFEGDQQVLKMLKRAYEKTTNPDGGIKSMVMPYMVDRLPDQIREGAYHVFMRDGSPNDLGRMMQTLQGYYAINDRDWVTGSLETIEQSARKSAGLSGDQS